MSTQDVITILLALALGPGIVVGVAALLAWFGGWRRLAETYPAVPAADDATRTVGSLSMGGAACYNNAVTYRLDDEHQHLRMVPILPFHPPMSIPTVAIRSIEPGRRKKWSRVVTDERTMELPTRAVQREIDTRAALEASSGQPATLDAPA